MNRRYQLATAWTMACVFVSSAVLNGQDKTQNEMSYLNQMPPGSTPTLFAPDIVSTDSRELNSVFSKGFDEFFFTRKVGEGYKIFISMREEKDWTSPALLEFGLELPDKDEVDMCLSPDEQRLYYISNRPSGKFADKSVNIWYSNRQKQGWSSPILLPEPINSDSTEVYPLIVTDGSMYFSSNRLGGVGKRDLYRAQYRNGQFINAVNLGAGVNTEFNEGDVYVDPEESFLIVSSWGRPDSMGKSDLYFSKKEPDGQWSPGVNMGEPFNSPETDFCPMLSPDGKYFFFSRNGEVYWVDARVLDQFMNN